MSNEPPVCANCNDEYWLKDGCEPTKYCDECAHEIVARLEAENAAANAKNEWLEVDNKRLSDALNEIGEKEFANSGYNLPQMVRVIADNAQLRAKLERMGRAEHEMYEDGRCQICGWTLCKSINDGCTAESCSMRPQEGSPDWYRLKERREGLLARRGEQL